MKSKLKLLLPVLSLSTLLACASGGSDDGGVFDDDGGGSPAQDSGASDDAGLGEDGGTFDDAGTDSGTPDQDAGPDGGPSGHCTHYNPTTKNLLWGDLHVHTSFSHDAFDFGNPSGPAAAYAFARGMPVALAPINGQPRTAKISRPLDFSAVTDHAEALDHSTFGGGSATSAWSRTQAAAAAANDGSPSCGFSSIYGFEWSGAVSGNWYHRNVVFKSDKVTTLPVDATTHPTPASLWTALDTGCTGAGTGCDVISIPHNSNYSQNGIIFGIPDTITSAQAKQRAKYERVAEVYQHKGNSECKVGVDSTDPECDYEQLFEVDCAATPTSPYCTYGSYIRSALKRGLELEQLVGTNPLQLGLIGSTDTHNSTPGNIDEYQYVGQAGTQDGAVSNRLDSTKKFIRQSGGGLVAVWAEENRREAVFGALKRREVYASSGPRIPLRMFGGWSLPANLCSQADLAAQGYASGVPMGGTLPTRPTGATAPMFVLSAMKDPGPAGHPNVDLQYAQVVKAWYDPTTHQTHEQVFDVAGNKSNGASVNTNTCAPSGAGQASLCTVWTDPTFNAAQPAVYYVRVFQNPTCTSRGFDCASLPAASRPPSCSATSTRLVDKERVWSSPVWYAP